MVERSRAPLASSRHELTPWPEREAWAEFALCRGARQRGSSGKRARIADAVLAWYDRERRRLPWRAEHGEAPDPYRVWLSEIMLQQTTVKAVLPRYDLFLRRWPDVTALARAELGEVLAAWAGLGYYARARNLHACARVVAERHGGKFPEDEAALRKLPGIGDYTAAAIAAIAFGKRATPVDGNIERVVARLFAVTTPLPAAKTEIRALAETLTPDDALRRLRPSDDGSWAPRSARRAGRPAASARCGPTAGAMPRVSPRRCLIARRRASGRSGAARPSLPSAPTAPCCCASGRCMAYWAACWRRRHRPGRRPSPAETPRADTRRSRPTGASCPAWSSTPSRIFISSFPSIARRSDRTRSRSARRSPSAAFGSSLAQLAGAALPSVMRKVLLHALEERARQPCGSSFARAASRKASIGLRLPSAS